MADNGSVRTVLGDIEPAELGFTHTHEHLLCDLSRPQTPRATASRRREDAEPITLANYYRSRRQYNSEAMRMFSVEDAVDELAHFTAHGGRTMVEATPVGLGRDPAALAEVARASGVRIVMGCGYYVRAYHPADIDELSQVDITAEIVRDITVGVDDTGVRAGIIGEIGMTWPVHPTELLVLRAAVAAQVETGAALLIHPGRDPRAPRQLIAEVEAGGGRLDRTIMSHIDRTLFDLDSMRSLASTGCYLEFDLFGQESSYYALAPIDMPNDATRVDYLQALIADGYGRQLVVAQDICHKPYLKKYGGEGYSHILEHVLPLMRRKGMSAAEIETITMANPARALTISS